MRKDINLLKFLHDNSPSLIFKYWLKISNTALKHFWITKVVSRKIIFYFLGSK